MKTETIVELYFWLSLVTKPPDNYILCGGKNKTKYFNCLNKKSNFVTCIFVLYYYSLQRQPSVYYCNRNPVENMFPPEKPNKEFSPAVWERVDSDTQR